MARATNKWEIERDGIDKFNHLQTMIGELSIENQRKEFLFVARDETIKDVLVHLYEWQELLLKWVDSNMQGIGVSFLPEPYNWRTYPKMNIELKNSHKDTSLEEAKFLFNQSHKQVLDLLERFDDKELFTKKYFSWTASTNLGSYFISSMPSHYDWAIKIIKQHKKTLGGYCDEL